jgi:hypothetical protein
MSKIDKILDSIWCVGYNCGANDLNDDNAELLKQTKRELYKEIRKGQTSAIVPDGTKESGGRNDEVVCIDYINELFSNKDEEYNLESSVDGTFNIPRSWHKIDSAKVWFSNFDAGVENGHTRVVYKRPDGSYCAPFGGRMFEVFLEKPAEFREVEK